MFACRHCGTSFRPATEHRGSFLNDFFRLALGLWALTLPVYCTWLAATTPDGWGGVGAYLMSQLLFVPWLIGIISLGILTWLTQER